jgi:hypothetical protein
VDDVLTEVESVGFVGSRRLRAARDDARLPVSVDGVPVVDESPGFGLDVFEVPNVLPEVTFFGSGIGVDLTTDFTLRRVT